MKKDMKNMRKKLEQQGWVFELKSSGHYQCRHPEVATPITSSASPSSGNAHKALEADCRRALRWAAAKRDEEAARRAA